MNNNRFLYILIGVVLFLATLLGFIIFDKFQLKPTTEKNSDLTILALQEKIKNDSISLVELHKKIINKTSEDLIDSLTVSFEKKLNLLIQQRQHLKKVTKNNKSKYSSNVKLYSKDKRSSNQTLSSNVGDKYTSNVTSYTKLPGYETPHTTSYKKPSKYTSNVKSYKDVSTTKYATNDIKKNIKSPVNIITKTQVKSKIVYDNIALNNAVNFNNLDAVPVFPSCEFNTDEEALKKCFSVKISQYVIRNFNPNVLKYSNLPKGVINKLRVLLIIDKDGYTESGKIIGPWDDNIKREVSRVIRSIPKMKPGYLNGNSINVKYSMLVPFVVK